MILRHDLPGKLQHLIGGGRIQCSGMLVQQQQLGGDQRGHEQRQRLTLTAGQQPHRLFHPVFQPQTQLGQTFREQRPVRFGDAGER